MMSELDTPFVKKLSDIFKEKWDHFEDMTQWSDFLDNLGVRRYALDAEEGIGMWWDFVRIINEAEEPVVACKCPTADWDDEDDPAMPVLIMSRELANKIMVLGYLPELEKSE